ncbi:XPG I and XPG N domain containing protein [Trichuris trichiura]|uniref:XPG I and XPG N domain containing protein n=1 Tax=Trichuris trichiura TaxID=36087 RepID=A0A077YYC4_TRITR|nr:XPG I and XPG N domain containing protein [Trichuris trichiura]
MGVKGLWKFLQPSSRLIKLDCLEGTKLSVDLSIWLHQAIHARVAAAISGSDEPRVHLQLLFHRLLKLLFYGIRAIFVFDGPEVSSLKKRTQVGFVFAFLSFHTQDSADFSTAQMKRLVNRSELSEKMSRIRNEIILSDPVIALSLSEGQTTDNNLVRLRKMLSRDQNFGMPVVKGPAEAEAQCAWLEENNITEGTITDDSDIWLFGGRRVYRHLFNIKKTVERFDMNTITNIYGLDRERLVLLAMLVGCDYTVGVEGIGAVTATEIIAEFDPTKEDKTSDSLECLRNFRAWCEQTLNGNHEDIDEPVARERFAKLAHCQFPGSFPDPLIFDAFLRPRVDQVDDRTLSWTLPDVDKIRNLTSTWFGWSKEQTDRHLLPVVKRAAALQSKRQKRIDDFCTTVAPTLPSLQQEAPLSQRVKRATSRLKATVQNRKCRRQSSPSLDTSSKLAGWCPSEADKPKRSRLT